jgi:hypothetical protein
VLRNVERAFRSGSGPGSGAYCRAGMVRSGSVSARVAALRRRDEGRSTGAGQPNW